MALTHSDLSRLLDRGGFILRAEAREVLERGEEFLNDLLLAAQGREFHRVYAAGVLLGALADPRAVPGLLQMMSLPIHDLRDVAVESLARIGPAALGAVLPLDSYAATCCLGLLGQFHPELRPRVAARLIELLSGRQGIWAAYGLADIDWQEAIPFIEANMDGPHWDRDSFYEADVARWREGTYTREEVKPDPLHWLAPEHEIELQRYLAELDAAQSEQFSSSEFSRRFAAELADLRPAVRTVVRQVQAGRNDPCPCGSGKKYKKCCLEADRSLGQLGPLEARLQNLEWPFHGYRLTPKEQLQQLPEAEVLAHLDILRMPALEVRARLAGEENDYLRWAGAHRLRLLGKLEEAQEAALSVALADGGHPALNYGEVAVLALNEVRRSRRRTPMYRLALHQGILIDAIYEAQALFENDEEQGFEAFEEILRVTPQPLWTAAALADSVPWRLAGRALPILEKAVEGARQGRSLPHPLLPERPCPAWILEAFAADLRRKAGDWHRLDLRIEESSLNPIDDEPRGIFFHLRDEEWKLSRTRPDDYRERLAELHARAAKGLDLILASRSPVRRKGVLVGQAAEGLVWVAPLRSEEPPRWVERDVLEEASDFALQALLRAAGEEGKATLRLREGHWGGWRAYLVPSPSADFSELASLALSEVCGHLPDPDQWQTVDADWPHLRALGGEEMLAEDSAPSAEPEPDAEKEEEDLIQVYLKRILTRMLRMNKVGAAHTELGFFFRGVPAQWRGDLKEILDLLIADGYIRLKPTLKSPHISLEPRRLPAVKQYLDGGPVPPGKLAAHLFEVSSSRV